jgi:hypothetical protein
MIELAVVDGRVMFVKWKINCTIPKPDEEGADKFYSKMSNHRVEPNIGAILAYTDDERAVIESKLKELGISYTVENISPSPDVVSKAKTVSGYIMTRSDMLNYLQNDILPDSVRIKKLLDYAKRMGWI